MANYGTLKAAIDAYIKRNGQQRITGDLLNAVLNAAVDALGMGYQFLGIATAQTDPGTPDARVFYIAGAGTYPNFGSTEIPDGGIGFFCYGDTWEYAVLQVGSGGGGGSEDAVLYTPQTLTTEQKSQARSNIGAGTYDKPSAGIPGTDLDAGVRTKLNKADSAVQPGDLALVASTGSYNDLTNKPEIPTDVVQYVAQTLTTAQKSQARTNIGAGTYTKSSSGIPKSDLASGVQTSLGKADTAYQKPSTGIPSTDLASAVQTSLGKADSAYQKPSTGIPASDLESGVIPTSVVQYTSQTLTDAQKAQARTNIGATAPEIFWATYGTTTASEIDAAVTAGKAVMCRYSGKDYALVYYESTGTYCYFGALYSTNAAWLRVQRSNNYWTAGLQGLEQAGNKVSTIVGNEADTAKFPNCKAVFDYLDGLAETWTFTLANGTSVSKRIIVLPEEEA
jgi:hypothetical protein